MEDILAKIGIEEGAEFNLGLVLTAFIGIIRYLVNLFIAVFATDAETTVVAE